MERVLAEIDERVDCRSPLDIYQRQYNIVSRNADTLKQIYDDNSKEGYVKVRKVGLKGNIFTYVSILYYRLIDG